jgi:hypothetical protein
MRLRDITIGLDVAAWVARDPERPRSRSREARRATVVDVGVPYGKGRGGVAVEYTRTEHKRRICVCRDCGARHPAYGYSVLAVLNGAIPDDAWEEPVKHVERVTVHHTSIATWEDYAAERIVRLAERELTRAAVRRLRDESQDTSP